MLLASLRIATAGSIRRANARPPLTQYTLSIRSNTRRIELPQSDAGVVDLNSRRLIRDRGDGCVFELDPRRKWTLVDVETLCLAVKRRRGKTSDPAVERQRFRPETETGPRAEAFLPDVEPEDPLANFS
jgi:hypothetical protein